MIVSALLSATLTFTATATGIEKGAPVEFFLAGPNSDRDYESMFVLDEPVSELCRRIDALVPRGVPVDSASCHLWPTGCRLCLEPSPDRFMKTNVQKGELLPVPIYTGGVRRPDGTPEAADVMPAAFFATYSLPQSPVVFSNPVDQGSAYGRFSAAVSIEKGKKFDFKLILDEKSFPTKVELTVGKGQLRQILERLKAASATNDVDATVSFSEALTVAEAIVAAQALSVVDSVRVKINGASGFFYRAFLPLEKWRDRRERLQQPFELTLLADGKEQLLYVDEDWKVEGNDPKLTPRQISIPQASQYPKTDTCFVFASKNETLSRLMRVKKLFPKEVVNWYVFPVE